MVIGRITYCDLLRSCVLYRWLHHRPSRNLRNPLRILPSQPGGNPYFRKEIEDLRQQFAAPEA